MNKIITTYKMFCELININESLKDSIFKIIIVNKKDNNGNNIGQLFKVNDITICETTIKKQLFCKIVHGSPEKIATISKIGKQTKWYPDGIEKITGFRPKVGSRNDVDFKEYYPDTTYGYTGHAVNSKEVLEYLNGFVKNKSQNKNE